MNFFFFEGGVLFCVMCVICVLFRIIAPLPPGKNPFAVKANKKILCVCVTKTARGVILIIHLCVVLLFQICLFSRD
jgi:hypothetical protein